MAITDLEETLKYSSFQTLYIIGTKDKIINHSSEINLIDAFSNPNIEVEVFTDLNHWLTEKEAKVGTSLYLMDKVYCMKL